MEELDLTALHGSYLKGRFSSGLAGTKATKQFGDLTGKQLHVHVPCELMHNNHNQMKLKLVCENSD